MRVDPVLHSHITDVLPEKHPLAYKSVYCAKCRTMVHAGNNECMMTWIECGISDNWCLSCFSEVTGNTVEDSFALNLEKHEHCPICHVDFCESCGRHK